MSTRLGDNPLKRKSRLETNIVRTMYKKKKASSKNTKTKSKPKPKAKPKKKKSK